MKTFTKISVFLLLTAGFMLAEFNTAQAQYFSFGKNRIQYETFDWRFIQSEHFDIYYYHKKNYDLAVFAALTLESSLRQYHEDFNHRIVDRIEVILYDSHNDFAQTNVVPLPVSVPGLGGVTDLFKNRITMPFTGDYDQFRAVLQHELNHAVLNDMFYGGSIQNAIGRSAVRLPLWFNEGLGEFESKGWDTETDAYIRDAILNDYLPENVSRLRGYFAYRGGQSVWNYIVQEYGRNKIGEILDAVQATGSVEAAFIRTMGLNLEEFSDNWHDYYREIYFPTVTERIEIDEFAELLTGEDVVGSYNTSPELSPEGDRIAIISNELRSFNVYILNTITGEVIKTLIDGTTNINFAELNILSPSLTWSPDGSKIALPAKSNGEDRIAIVDVSSGDSRFLSFPDIDAIGSVAWSPDGQKLAFAGNYGPFQDIYVYNLETEELQNVTNDVITDVTPVWGPDSELIYFTSYRGNLTDLNVYRNASKLLARDDMYTSDIYSVRPGAESAVRLTETPEWNEFQPDITNEGELLFISDKNGVNNIYQIVADTVGFRPLTNLQTGAEQFSINNDGSVMAISTINEGGIDIYLVNTPFSDEIDAPLSDNHWANRRENEARFQRVPAIGYVQNLARNKDFINFSRPLNPIAEADTLSPFIPDEPAPADTISVAAADSVAQQQDAGGVDFRNYVFAEEVTEDSIFVQEYMDEAVFEIENNTTENERYIPTGYRPRFTVDLVYGSGGFSTYYGSYGLATVRFSDLLGNHRAAFGTTLNFDLVNSNYFLQYGNFKGRTDLLFTLSHSSFNISRARRYRYFSLSTTIRYPLNTFERFDFKLAGINIASDFSLPGLDINLSDQTTFAYPQVIYTNDRSIRGLLTPIAGFRYSVAVGGSPPITNETLQFASVIGDFRKYFHLGGRYSVALRFSGGASFGRDSQTFFMGGVLGWINRKANDFTTPALFGQDENFARIFITAPAIPLRGYERFVLSGDKFGLLNLEFRFPLFAAILPGPIPILPLFNITGLAFIDAGVAWGQDVFYTLPRTSQSYYTNPAELNFAIREQNEINGLPAPEGDVLIGAGFGLRAIVFGLPLRYDIGWPYYRNGFGSDPIHYISIGIDF